MNKFKKTIAGVLGFAVALSFAVAVSSAPAKADAISDLLAQIAALTAQVNALKGGTATASVTFTRSLTIGSSGADVTALQNWLIAKGFSIPAGATGYFGAQTKAALAAYQAANGIAPAAGYFGPITMAKVNASAVATVPGTTPGTTPSGITTPGVEGTIAVTESSAGIKSTVYEGDSMAPILGVEVEAKNSDIAVQRIKIDLGTTTKIYNKIYSKLYVTDGSNVLASVNLDSTNVVKGGTSSNRYYVTIAGFNLIVPKNSKKVLTIKADVRGSIDSTDRSAGDSTLSWGVRLDTNGVRGVDGAGIDQYGGATSVGKSITVSQDLAETATAILSTNTNTPASSDVIASLGSSENELDRLALLSFDLKAEKDAVTFTDLAFDIDKAGTGGATASTTVYLYDGSTEIDNATIDSSGANGSYVVFDDVDVVVAKDATKTFTLKVDVRNANGTVSQLSATASSSGFTAENSKGDTVTTSGSATSETQYVRNVGPVFTLVSKTISKSQTAANNNYSTSTAQATFTLKIKAVGGPIQFGSVASTAPMVGSSSPFIVTYLNGAASTLLVASSTAFDVPSTGVDTSGLDASFTLPEGNEITIPVTFTFEGRLATGVAISTGAYSIALERIAWKSSGAQTTTFMAGETDWRTSTVSLP